MTSPDGLSQKSATPVDLHVGRRIRERRLIVNMSQMALADRLGVTFQQVQKYENGGNRISASRLFAIAAALGVPISYFFEGIEGAQAGATVKQGSMVVDKDGAELLRAFNSIEDQKARRTLVDIVTLVSRA